MKQKSETVEIEFSGEALEQLEELRREMDVESIEDVVINSIKMRKLLSDQKKKGRNIVLMDRNEDDPLELVFG